MAIDPSKMSYLWIDGKLHNKKNFLKRLLKITDTMPHSTFFYPNTNNQNTFIDALAKDLKIIFNFEVVNIEKLENKWIVNGEYQYDILIMQCL